MQNRFGVGSKVVVNFSLRKYLVGMTGVVKGLRESYLDPLKTVCRVAFPNGVEASFEECYLGEILENRSV